MIHHVNLSLHSFCGPAAPASGTPLLSLLRKMLALPPLPPPHDPTLTQTLTQGDRVSLPARRWSLHRHVPAEGGLRSSGWVPHPRSRPHERQSTGGIIGSLAFSLDFPSYLTSCFSPFSTFETQKNLANDHAMPGSFHRFLWILPSP